MKYVLSSDVKTETINGYVVLFQFTNRRTVKLPETIFPLVLEPSAHSLSETEKTSINKLVQALLASGMITPDLSALPIGISMHINQPLKEMVFMENSNLEEIYIDASQIYTENVLEWLEQTKLLIIGIVSQEDAEEPVLKICEKVVLPWKYKNHIKKYIKARKHVCIEVTEAVDFDCINYENNNYKYENNNYRIELKFPLFTEAKQLSDSLSCTYSPCFFTRVFFDQYKPSISNEKQRKTVDAVLSSFKLGCKAGRRSIYVNKQGYVYFCYHDKSLDPILHISKINNLNKDIRKFTERINVYNINSCKQCNVKYFCGNLCRNREKNNSLPSCEIIRDYIIQRLRGDWA